MIIINIISILSIIISTIAVILTYLNLREIKKQFFQQNRGQLIFYIDKDTWKPNYYIIIKNFGHLPTKLIELKINPPLEFKGTCFEQFDNYGLKPFIETKDIFLAPNQLIKSEFDIINFKKNKNISYLEIEITYETCQKTFTDKYSINLDYLGNITKSNIKPSSELNALIEINKSIQSLSDRFL